MNKVQSNKKIVDLLFETNAFQHLDKPVILTSGELGIYYINTEKLCQDNGEFEKYGNDPQSMMNHSIKLYQSNRIFKKVIDALADLVTANLDENSDMINEMELQADISGGQRRDWLFSFPVAYKLQMPHITLFKDSSMHYIYDNKEISKNGSLRMHYALHVADLLTEGSSAAKVWVPALRNAGAEIYNIFHVVTRLQGGEENLAKLDPPVYSHSLVAINPEFIKMGKGTDKQKERAICYMKDPKSWSKTYISENGIDDFIKFFDPRNGKPDRAEKFFQRYKEIIEESGNLMRLKSEVLGRYGVYLH